MEILQVKKFSLSPVENDFLRQTNPIVPAWARYDQLNTILLILLKMVFQVIFWNYDHDVVDKR